MKIIVGSRGSNLALTQTKWLIHRLKEKNPEVLFELKIIKTKGDQVQHLALDKIGDKGLFTKALEDALLAGDIHMAVHSMKDMPSRLPRGLTLGVPTLREDARDVLVTPHAIRSLKDLPENATVATGSKRRAYQLKALRPDLSVVGIRGNIDTRIQKMLDQKLDGVILAASGLKRANLFESDRYHCYPLSEKEFIPAPAQGILAVEITEDNAFVKDMLTTIMDENTHRQMLAERSFLETLDGSCHIPMGAYLDIHDQEITLYGLYGSQDGSILHRGSLTGKLGEEESLGQRLAEQLKEKVARDIAPGTVYLTGAGCGDEGLLTVKAQEVLKSCDVLVYDALVNSNFLRETKPECEHIYVGKRAKNHAMPQDEINQLLVRLAQAGKNVVRLKGGDPYVFGRGGEEGEVLYDAGVPFEVIPGITSVIGGLAYAGIPITHRDCVASFQIVTGHRKEDGEELDWQALANYKGTTVFLMGVKNLKSIMDNLMDKGMRKDMPVAVVHKASTPSQRVVSGTIESIYDTVVTEKITAPSLIVVGDVVSKREKLRFFDNKPLFGKRVVVTRSRNQSSKMVKQLEALGAQTIMYPTITVEPILEEVTRLAEVLEDLQSYTHLVMTSVNGVEIFFRTLHQKGLDARALAGLHITAVGPETKKAFEQKGIVPDFMPKRYVGEELIDGLWPITDENSKILIPRSKNARVDVVEALQKKCVVEEIQIYQTLREDLAEVDMLDLLKEQAIDYITFTSSTTAQYFVEKIGKENIPLIEQYKTVSIGPITSAKMKELGLPISMEAEVYTIAGMIAALLNDVQG